LFLGSYFAGFSASTSGVSVDVHEICEWHFEKTFSRPIISDKLDPNKISKTKTKMNSRTEHRSQPSLKQQEQCDQGFSTTSCVLDTSETTNDCLLKTHDGCIACISTTSSHCLWCASEQRCISSDVTNWKDKNQLYCTDLESIVEDVK
jgi:hypothetical protein